MIERITRLCELISIVQSHTLKERIPRENDMLIERDVDQLLMADDLGQQRTASDTKTMA